MDSIAVVDFGGQYAHLIANRIRRLGVFSEIVGCTLSADEARRFKGLILSGGPNSVLEPRSPSVSPEIFSLGIPVLGLCYGHQLMAKLLGGSVCKGQIREYGRATISIIADSPLFHRLKPEQSVWMSHGDSVDSLPDSCAILASSCDCPAAAVGDEARRLYGLQFHPEVADTPGGMTILENFITICGCAREWNTRMFYNELTSGIKQTCANRNVFLLVSGGVDSTVAFALCNEALGAQRVRGLHIDTGLMRQDESEDILSYMREHGFDNLEIVDAGNRFLDALKGVWDPEEKREIIGNTFIEVQQRALKEQGLNEQDWLLGQGTIYPDTIESAGTEHADKIKTHHNRVDIILQLLDKGLVIEPLSQLYKDEVRALGESLGLPRTLVWRHPFPGPGLGVRALCSNGVEVAVDSEVQQQAAGIAESFGFQCHVLPLRSVGVQGDSRTYAHPALLCGACDWNALEECSTRITNTIRGINRVVYKIGSSTGNGNYKIIEAYLTKDRLDKLRAIDHEVSEALFDSGEYEAIWQMPVVLLPLADEQGDECVVLRPISSQEAMTARFVPLKDATIARILHAARSIAGIGDILIDITHKPPGTIEWE
jgi:GMP synthase (glutamine-hydrolysing)